MKVFFLLVFYFSVFRGYTQDLIIKHINIIDLHKKVIQYNRSILISKGKIQKISTNPIKGRNAVIINGKGKFLIPGLWDMHVHIVDSSYLDLFIINGVTGIRDMGGAALNTNNGCESIHPKKLMIWRNLIQSGSLIGPRMVISGPVVSNTGWATSININTPESAREAVKELKEMGVDFIKVYEKIPLETYLELAKEANAAGMSIAGHVPVETVPLSEAANAGHRSIEHIRDPLLMFFTEDRDELLNFFKEDEWATSDIEWGLKQFDQSSKVIKVFKRNNTWLVPTLSVERSKVAVRDSLYINDEIRKMLPESVRNAFTDYVIKKLALPSKERKSDSLWWAAQKKLVNRMHKEGIPMMAGTDCACEGGIPGYSIHKELQLFVEAGLTTFDALQTATINPIKFLDLTDSLGTVEKGKIADLIILNRNPIDDISATQKIFAVIRNGQLISKKQLEKVKNNLKKNIR